ncbi:MAG: hypothetical protein IJH76_02090 [Clostridia bacterium]|nr:hypothetical protein [Clostridia bacterium]
MGKVKYLFTRIKKMDKKVMFNKISEIHKKTGKNRIALFFDMVYCGFRYGAGYMDYDLYEMYNLTSKQRDTYLTRGRNNAIDKKFNNKAFINELELKDRFNTNFNKYLKRDWVKVDGTDKKEVINFLNKHSEFMAKPIDGSCGKKIEKLKVSDFKSLDDLYEYLQNKNFELEEVLVQNDEVAKIYPYYINTLRTVTILKDGEAHIITAMLRIGNNMKFVDNFNSGGMVAPVDEKTGVIIKPAIDKNKQLYEVHPITGTQIKGFQIPFWKETIEMVKEAAKVIPEVGYVGWDVGFTPNGPVFVEANDFPGHDIYQLPEHTPEKIGIWPKFNKYLK